MRGEAANCYAYACDDKHPQFGTAGGAVPGAYAGQGVSRLRNDTPETYADRMVEGVRLDGDRNNVVVTVGRDIHALPDCEGGYIIAMASNIYGFHFFRRDRVTRLWSWKDGIGED